MRDVRGTPREHEPWQAVALDARIGARCAELMGWRGCRLAQDDVLWKPPGAGGVAYHTDGKYISENFVPRARNGVTVWIALDAADEETGVVEYAPGSQDWGDEGLGVASSSFHDGDGEEPMRRAARAAGVDPDGVAITRLSVPVGSAVFHHQDVWHGSGTNVTPDRPRRALGLHYIRDDLKLRRDPPPDYIYGRYDLGDGGVVHDAFFPLVYSDDPSATSPIADRRRAGVPRP